MALPFRYSAAHLAARRGRSAATAAVVAMVVLATALFSGLVSSLRSTLVETGSAHNLIVLRKGASNDASSFVTLEDYRRLRLLPGIARDAAGEPLVSPELVVEPGLARPDGRRESVLVRGVDGAALAVHDEVKVTAGRMLRPAAGEALVGRGVAERFGVAGPGAALRFGRRSWQVVGILESGGSAFESEVWVDVRELAADTGRSHPFSGLRLRVAPGADADALARRIADDPQALLHAEPERAYYAEQAEVADALQVLVVGLALLAGTAASFGAANTLYASVHARRREIGTLRALGFPGRAILRAVLSEALLLCLAGFVLGVVAAAALGAGLDRWLGGVAFEVAFATQAITVPLRLGPGDLALALALVLAIAAAGGLLPALRAARLEPAEALRRGGL